MKKIIYNVIALSLISFVVLLYAHGNMSKATIGFLKVTKQLTVTAAGLVGFGSDGNGIDVTFYTDVAGEEMLWDASDGALEIDGTNASDALVVSDGNVAFTDDLDVDGVTNLDVTDIDGAVDMATTLLVTGVSTLTGGVVYPTATAFIWSVGGATLVVTGGTDETPIDGQRQWVQVNIPYNVTLTGIGYMVGTVGGSDSVVVELKDSAGATVARSIATNTEIADIVGATAVFNNLDFSSTYAAVAGIYYIVVQMNGTTARFRTYGVEGSKFVTGTAAGTFKTDASITPGTSFTVDEGPISYVY